MALPKERTQQSTSQQPFVQGVDADSLHYMGSENHFPTYFDATHSSNRAYMTYEYGQQSSDAVQWAYNSSSSSVLKFNQGDHFSKANSKVDGDEQEVECALWLDGFQDGGDEDKDSQKRPCMGGDLVAAKKQRGNNRKTKAKPSAASKDPQSIAAKNRRERISERLKVLQDLVPNGTKVDLVTMLEKAISYVKFLQLQVKVLAADEFWPAQGGRAPELSQVKDAIDAILSSSRERKSSSTSQD